MTDNVVKSKFPIHEVVVLSGFTKYMLDYLAREDIFRPTGFDPSCRGRRRLYSYEDVVLLRALHKICAGKGKIRHLKASLRSYRRTMGAIVPGQNLERLLVVQGNKLCTATEGEGVRELVSGQLTLSFVIDLGAVSREVARCITVDPRSLQVSLTKSAKLKADHEREKIWAPIKARRAGLGS